MVDQTPPNKEPSAGVNLKESLVIFWNWFLPRDAKWKRINAAFLTVYAVLVVPTYFLGLSNLFARKIIYYVWRTSIFGMFGDGIPYSCYPPESRGEGQLCDYAPRLLQDDTPRWIYAHWSIVLLFVGGAISVRLILFCFEALERGLGIDFISRLIDKFLPGPKSGNDVGKKE